MNLHLRKFLLTLTVCMVFACQPVRGAQPDIVFIVVDDLNDWAGFLGGHPGMKIQTPNIDRLAATSMIFTNAHTPAPACAPTRAAILTGVHHARSGAEHCLLGRWAKVAGI